MKFTIDAIRDAHGAVGKVVRSETLTPQELILLREIEGFDTVGFLLDHIDRLNMRLKLLIDTHDRMELQ